MSIYEQMIQALEAARAALAGSVPIDTDELMTFNDGVRKVNAIMDRLREEGRI